MRPTRPAGALAVAALAALVALVACNGSDDAPPPDGHARMREAIATIAAETPDDNPWLGEANARYLRRALEKARGSAPPRELAGLHASLGMCELQLGNDDDAIGHFDQAVALLREPNSGATNEELGRALYGLATAHLRVAEKRNCVAHHDPESCRLPIRGGGVHVDPEPARHAAAALEEVLELLPDDAPATWLLNVAYMTLGRYPDGVPERYRIPPEAFASEREFPRFPDVARDVGLATLSVSGGAVVDDFDGDDLLDVIVSSWDARGELHYFRNRGDGRFEDRTEDAGLVGLAGCLNMVQADYDDDGDTDLYLLRGGWLDVNGQHLNSLLRNDGAGRFADVTFDAGLGRTRLPTQTAAWADYDADGDLDLYVGNESTAEIRASSELFRNDGDGTFTNVADTAGVTNDRFTKAVVWGDYDGDGDPDIYVSNMRDENRLYRNDGDGTFTDVAPRLGVTGPERSFPAWFWDFDNDGVLDVFASAYVSDWKTSPMPDLVAPYLGRPTAAPLPALYRGDGRGHFEDVAVRAGLTRPNLPMGANFGDLDNDGFLDFYLGTGEPSLDAILPNVMFHNQGGERFIDVSVAGGFSHVQKGHAIAFADLDNDGDLDVFERMGGAYVTDVFPDALYRNPGFGNHWLSVRLVGVDSNRSAIGARIKAEIEEGGRRRAVYRHVSSGGSFGANPLRQTLGLGKASRIAVLEIHWPTTGRTQRFEDVAADRLVQITEGADEIRALSPPRFRLGE